MDEQNLERTSMEEANIARQRLAPLFELLEDLQTKESDICSSFKAKKSELPAEISKLEEKLLSGNEETKLSNCLDQSLSNALEKLNSAKTELASKLRTTLHLKRQLDSVPTQTELIQYERRFTELDAHIQEKLRRTRKYYATYNALLEIKELMLKETSLMNSISSQFQDAITSTAGRMKLIDSMEGILKGTQQKLEKVEIGLRSEQKTSDAIKERYVEAVAGQRQCSVLLKAFQEECAKNERLRSQTQG